MRTAIADHLFSWGHDGRFEPVFLNVKRRGLPRWVLRLSPDLVVLHTTLLGQRWNPAAFDGLRRALRPLSRSSIPIVALPQDEFIHTHALVDLLAELRVGFVLSCAEPSEWPKIYGVLGRETRLATALTGYLEPRTLRRIERLRRSGPLQRPIDIGYRAWRAQPWLGRHGMLKTEIGERIREQAGSRGIRANISLDDRDTLLGDAWLRFLLASRWVPGVEGGASILDTDGTVKACTETFLATNPEASFDDVEAACFPGRDGELNLFAISPRHLEACATRTGQVLVEGRYNGILVANRHYLPVRSDLADLDAALDRLRDEDLRLELVEAAYRDVVASGRFTYSAFLDEVRKLLGDAIDRPPAVRRDGSWAKLHAGVAAGSDLPSRGVLRLRGKVVTRLGELGLLAPARRVWRTLKRA